MDVEALRFERCELPAAGGAVRYYPGAGYDSGGDGVLMRLRRADGETWLCMIAESDARVAGPFLMPDGKRVYANGYIVDCDEPERWEEAAVWPVLGGAWSPSRRELVLHDYAGAAAYGADGLLWTHQRLALDEIEIESVTDDRVAFRGCDYGDDKPGLKSRAVTLDLQTGRFVEGRAWGTV